MWLGLIAEGAGIFPPVLKGERIRREAAHATLMAASAQLKEKRATVNRKNRVHASWG